MEKTFKKMLSLILAALMLMALFSGCSSKSGSESSQVKGSDAWKTKDITLQFWDNDTRADWQTATQKVFDGFTVLHPNIKIQRMMVPWNDINTKFQVAVAAKSQPDFMYGSDKYIVPWATQKSLAPLDDILDAIGRKNFPQSMLTNSSTGGKSYLVPIAFFPHVVFYRKDLYAKYSLKVPTTWDQLYQNAKTIQDNEKGIYGFDILAAKGEPYTLVNFMSVDNAALLDKNLKVTANSPNTVESLTYIQKMSTLIPPGTYGKTQADVRLIAIQGTVAHHIDSVSFSGTISSEKKLDLWGTFPVPQNSGTRGAITGYYGFAVSATNSDNLQATKELIKHMNQPDVYLGFAQASILGHIPANKTATDNNAYWANSRVAPFENMFKSAEKAGQNGIVMGMDYGANKYSSAIVSSYIYNDMLDMVILNKQTPQDAAKSAATKMKSIMDDVDNQ